MFVFALAASACGGDGSSTDSTVTVSTDASVATVSSSVADGTTTSVGSIVDEVAQVTTVEGDVTVTVSSATGAQPGTRLFAAGQPASMTAVDGDDVFFLTFAPGGLAALNRVSTATGDKVSSDLTWTLSGVLPLALTTANLWTLSPGDQQQATVNRTASRCSTESRWRSQVSTTRRMGRCRSAWSPSVRRRMSSPPRH